MGTTSSREITSSTHIVTPITHISIEGPRLLGSPSRPKDNLPAPYNVVAEHRTLGSGPVITVWATVLMPVDATKTDCIQTFTLDPDGNVRLQFHICYSRSDNHNSDIVFQQNQYAIDVSKTHLLPSFELSDVTSVEVFLWDEDPKTSRGTVTTVTHSSTGSER